MTPLLRFQISYEAEESSSSKKKSGKKKKKTTKKPADLMPQTLEGLNFVDTQEPTTTTLLMARDEMKNGLPQGAVEIGTIAETEPGRPRGCSW